MSCMSCGSEISDTSFVCEKCDQEEYTQHIIEFSFHRGYPYKVIVKILEKHGVFMHLRTLKRKLRSLGLKKQGNEIDESVVRELLYEEMKGPGQLSGYRSLWHSLRLKHHVHVPRRIVARLVKEIDPQGVEQRSARKLSRRKYTSPGPNSCWHLDGYDKLKPYGFPIHGGICGFSRKILWLSVVHSNNDPKVPGRLYLDCVKELGGCPLLVRTDCGSENGIVAAMQCSFREGVDEMSSERAHQYGTSPSNQRIEGWWAFLRRSRTGWWIDLFKDLIESGTLHLGNTYHMKCLWFCFSQVLQSDLDKVKEQWNSHYIRKSHHNTIPGIPDILFHLPEYVEAQDCLVPVSEEVIDGMEPYCETDIEGTYDIHDEYFEYIMQNETLQYPCNADDAVKLFEYFITLEGT